MKFKGITIITVCLRETYPTPRDDYLKYCERENQLLSGLGENLSRLPARTYILGAVFSFQGHYLPSSLNEKWRERQTEKEREREEENRRGTRVYIPLWSGVNIPERIDLCG